MANWRWQVGMALLLGLCATEARADLHFEQPRITVGEVRCGAPLAREFAFVNDGNEPVEIVEVKTSCGCVATRMEQKTLTPGQKGSLRVEITTLTQASGPHRWPAHVTWKTGGQTRETVLELLGQVVTELVATPASLTLFTSQALSRELVLTDLRAQPLHVTGVHTSSPHLEARVTQAGRDDQGHASYKIVITVAAELPAGRHEEIVGLLTDDAGYPEVRIPVTILKEIKGAVTVSPNPVTITAVPGQSTLSRLVLVRDPEGSEVVVEKVTADDPAITCTWSGSEGGPAAVRVRVDASRLHEGALESAIHIHVSKPKAEILSVPIRVE